MSIDPDIASPAAAPRASSFRGKGNTVAVGMPRFRGTPRTDPGKRNYRTGLLPRVRRAGAVPDKDVGLGVSVDTLLPVCSCVSTLSGHSGFGD